jgi:hypothetical protein
VAMEGLNSGRTSKMSTLSSRLPLSEEEEFAKELPPLPSFFLAMRNSTSRFRIWQQQVEEQAEREGESGTREGGKEHEGNLFLEDGRTLIKDSIASASLVLTCMSFHLLSAERERGEGR